MRPLCALVDLAAIRHNHAVARRCAPGSKVFAVVRANAYGHGVREVVTALHADADGFAVATLEEAAEVRAMHGQARILVLQGCFTGEALPMAAHLSLDLLLHSREQVQALLGATLSQPLRVWLALGSEPCQPGFAPWALREVAASLHGAPQVAEVNLLGQLACAEAPVDAVIARQMACVAELLDLPFSQRSLAASAATLSLPAAHMDWVRPGSMLYGASPFTDRDAAQLGLQPALSLNARLMAVRDLATDGCVGRDAAPSRIGVVSCGYADGYPGQAPGGTPLLVRGRRVPLVGRVAMDMLCVDLGALPDARVGDEVQLWGALLPVDEVARAVGCRSAALLAGISARVPRRYVGG
ncbi:alanine racemase [Phytopseudomonas dryadis]|uniref:Alanine racemase n=1 Tax=Phytopseudomonas dryadis TaxID=2487520 RepID=A0A4Q9QWA3_9GAMM|nr:alanine racemase [Pseudomonas dryadis]TBU87248.1 alanine racemase [Pseudomonas dryadis]